MRRNGYPHLPPGRDPGRQSKRDRFGFPLVTQIAVVLGGILVAAFTVRSWSGGARALAYLLLPAMVVVFGGRYIYGRESLRLASRRLRLEVAPREPRRGEVVTATVRAREGLSLDTDAIQVGLVCVERFDEVSQRPNFGKQVGPPVTETDVAHEEWQEVNAHAAGASARFELPVTAPYSYEGRHVSFAWRVSARKPGRDAADPIVDHPIWVLP